jgi:hypothetical protein
MLKKNKNYINLIFGISLGIISTLFFKKITQFEINNQISLEINPLDLLFALLNIFLAFYITKTLGKKMDDEKNKKLLITNFLDEFRKDFIKLIKDLIDNEEFNNNKVRFEFKNFRQRNFQNSKLIKELRLLDENDNDEIENLRVTINKLWEEFTDVPINESNVNIMLRLQNIYSLVNDFENSTIQLIFKINK